MSEHLRAFGWAPGQYLHRHCSDCDNEFQADKRASRCEACATAAYRRWEASRKAFATALDPKPTLERIRAKVVARTDLHDRDSAGVIGINMGDLRALLEEIGQ